MGSRITVGMLTPSSNTILEPLAMEVLGGLPDVSVHFARLRVTEVSLSDYGMHQFDPAPVLQAASLLADARCRVIAWNATAGGWRGFHDDEELVRQIEEATGARATTAILSNNRLLRHFGVTRLGVVTPYNDEVTRRIVDNFNDGGFNVVGERHLGITDNSAFSEVPDDTTFEMCREVARAQPEAISIICTNMRGAPLVEAIENETGIPVFDSVSVVLLRVLELAGVDTTHIVGWGRMFATGSGND